MVIDSIHMLEATRKAGRRRGEEPEVWGKEKIKTWRKRWRRQRRKKKRVGAGPHSDTCVCHAPGNKDPLSHPR